MKARKVTEVELRAFLISATEGVFGQLQVIAAKYRKLHLNLSFYMGM